MDIAEFNINMFKETFTTYDANADQKITFYEFYNTTLDFKLKRAFKKYDVNTDGNISFDEFTLLTNRYTCDEVRFTLQDKESFDKQDLDKDGEITYPEFLNAMYCIISGQTNVRADYWQGRFEPNTPATLASTLEAKVGDKLFVTVTGEVKVSANSSAFGPGGDPNRQTGGPLLYPDAPAGALILLCGNTHTPLLKEHNKVVISNDGKCSFLFNERAPDNASSDYYKDNSGGFDIAALLCKKPPVV